jgi:hypothetical protein
MAIFEVFTAKAMLPPSAGLKMYAAWSYEMFYPVTALHGRTTQKTANYTSA